LRCPRYWYFCFWWPAALRAGRFSTGARGKKMSDFWKNWRKGFLMMMAFQAIVYYLFFY
tara:strand:+ start:5292 stop:5468 length:177 start_codon:yes stop_codon:yes gene_type:complete